MEQKKDKNKSKSLNQGADLGPAVAYAIQSFEETVDDYVDEVVELANKKCVEPNTMLKELGFEPTVERTDEGAKVVWDRATLTYDDNSTVEYSPDGAIKVKDVSAIEHLKEAAAPGKEGNVQAVDVHLEEQTFGTEATLTLSA